MKNSVTGIQIITIRVYQLTLRFNEKNFLKYPREEEKNIF